MLVIPEEAVSNLETYLNVYSNRKQDVVMNPYLMPKASAS